jgi:CVNH domain
VRKNRYIFSLATSLCFALSTIGALLSFGGGTAFASTHVFAATHQTLRPAGGYQNSCNTSTMNITSNGILEASCKTNAGTWHYSTLNFNLHISNNNGDLTTGAGFVQSCYDIGEGYYSGYYYLDAICYAENGNALSAGFDFRNYVGNNNGNLVWG